MTTEPNPILIDIPMPIRTPRLLLRPVMPGDGADLLASKVESLDVLQPWMPWARNGAGDFAENEALVRAGYARFILREDIWLVGLDRESNLPVLWTGMPRLNWERRSFEIGFWVRKSAHGRGYATESTNALIRYAFGALAATRVGISHVIDNNASRRVIEKLGFTLEGVSRRDDVLANGQLTDSCYYARLDLAGLPPLDVQWGQP